MKKLLAAAVGSMALGLAAPAMAADLAARPYTKSPPVAAAFVSSWTGWYVGVNGGWAFDNNSTGTLVASTPGFAGALAAGGTPTFFGANHEGGFGGGQVGYNWQTSKWLVGMETDIQGADIGRTSTIVYPGGAVLPSVSAARDHIDWFGTLRGRVGVVSGPALFYATGGLAYGGVKTNISNVFTPAASGAAFGSDGSTRVGWVAGAGAEWEFAPNWSVKGEYLHMDLGSSNATMADLLNFPGDFATYRFRHVVDAVRVGVNYRLRERY